MDKEISNIKGEKDGVEDSKDDRLGWAWIDGFEGMSVWKEIRAADGIQTKKKFEERLKSNNKRKVKEQRKDKNNRVRESRPQLYQMYQRLACGDWQDPLL